MKYGREIKWTKETVIKEAKKYKNKEEFERKAGGAHKTAYDKGWAEEACAHMPTFSEQITKWTPEKITKEALKYNTRIEFCNYSPNAYKAGCKKGIIDKVCSHMERLSKRLEELILHPKIEKIIQDNSFVKKQTYFRHLRVAREIPDFILITDKYVIIIEAKTCATHPNVGTYSLYTCQVEKQIKAIKEDQRFIEKKVLHFLVSELGSVKANKTDLNMSLKDLKIALKLCKKDVSKRELIKIIKKSRIKKSINQIKRDHYKESLKIRQDFNNRFEPIKMK